MGEIIKKRRVILNITQQELADYSGVSLRMIVALENNKANPSLRVLESIASVLGMVITMTVKTIES